MATTESNVFKSSMGKYMLIEEEHTASVLAKIWENETKVFRKEQEARAELRSKTLEKIAQLEEKKSKGLTELEQQQLAEHKKTLQGLAGMDEAAASQRTEREKRARDIAKKYAENSYKSMTLFEKAQYDKKVKDELVAERAALKEKEKLLKAAIETETDEKKKSQLQQQLIEVKAEGKEKSKQIKEQNKLPTVKEIVKDPKQVAPALVGSYKLIAAADKKHAQESKVAANKRINDAKSTQKAILDQVKASDEYKNASEKQRKELLANARASEEYQEALEEENDARKDVLKSAGENATAAVKDKINEAFSQLDNNIQQLYGNQAKYSARLQGTDLDWKKAVQNVYNNIGYSGAVSTKDVVKKMELLVDKGIAYNLELRAFLADTSENIAATFDAANGTLLRIIRLQQQDTTAARLGMEATLTKLFNSMFEDSSYLADNISEAITDKIVDASMTMSRDMSLEFEYVLQKWMGALYSLGMSAEGVQNIATAINYLGTGNVSALNNNEAMQTLLAMSATKAGGKSYADMLTQGINASDTNKLLKAMIEYLAEIAETQENMVTKSAFADIFGMNITDLSSFASLKKSEIASIYSSKASYSDFVGETNTQLRQILTRKNIVQLVDTAIDNALTGVAVTYGSNAALYGTWKALGILEDMVGEVKIPSVMAAGFGIGDLDLLNVAQTVMMGIGLVGSLVGALGSAFSGGATNLSTWDFNESTKRGGGLALLSSGSSSGTSLSTQLSTVAGSASDFEAITYEQAESTGKKEYDKIVSEDLSAEKGIDTEIYEALVDGDEDIISVTKDIRALLGGGGGGGGSAPVAPGDSSDPYESAVGASGSASSSDMPSKIYELLSVSFPTNNETLQSIYDLLENKLTGFIPAVSGDSSESYEPSEGTYVTTDMSLTNSLLYQSLFSGKNTLISVVQDLSNKLDEQLGEQRVFYTSIISESSAPSDTSNKVSDLSSQVAVNGATNKPSTDASVTSTPTTGTSVSTGSGQTVGGSSMTTNAANPAELQEIITAAVEAAIRLVSGYDGNSGIPVYVTNLHTYGG